MMNYKKYKAFPPVNLPNRQWPGRVLTQAPVWCSVDLRDGNQALPIPMNVGEKMEYFQMLIDIGFKEIEIGFPSASETEFRFLRELIEQKMIPAGVTVQVLTQSRRHLIERTFESLEGVKSAIVHLYNSTSTLQRRVVFGKDKPAITAIAVEGAQLVQEFADKAKGSRIMKEYSPESFTGTELDYAVEISEAVMDVWKPTTDNKMIINLPATVEMSTPNIYADQIEYFSTKVKNRDKVLISLHTHNDRGTSVAASELALLAGADRVEGTLFGNGERTGNSDILTIALNLYSQGIDPKLDFSAMQNIVDTYERTTRMSVHPRHPYAGELVFTAFSGSHQDAIRKGLTIYERENPESWEVPYLPIDPADFGREYEAIIRINSQSGKGGVAFIMEHYFGYKLPKDMHPEFGRIVQKVTDTTGKELNSEEIMKLFKAEYLEKHAPLDIKSYKVEENQVTKAAEASVTISAMVSWKGQDVAVNGQGNGPIDAFVKGLNAAGIPTYRFRSYDEHALSEGSDSKAVSYISLENDQNDSFYGVGIAQNITAASLFALVSAINRMN